MRSIILLLLLPLLSTSLSAQTDRATTPDSLKSTKTYGYITLQAGLLVPNPSPVPGQDIATSGLPIHLKLTNTYGIMNHPHVALGLGTGLIILDRGMVIPLIAEIRGDILDRDITPFYYGQIGAGIPTYSAEEGTDWWGNTIFEDFKASPGLLIDAGIGLKVRNNEKSATTLSVGFQVMELKESYTAWGSSYKNTYQFQRLSIQGGWFF